MRIILLKTLLKITAIILFLLIGAVSNTQMILEQQIPKQILPLINKVARDVGVEPLVLASAAFKRSNFGRINNINTNFNENIPIEIMKFIDIPHFGNQNIFNLSNFKISNFILKIENNTFYGFMLLSQHEILISGNLNPFDYEQSLTMLAKTITLNSSTSRPHGLPTCCIITLRFGEVYPNDVLNHLPNIQRFHTGIDIADKIDNITPVFSTMNGVVTTGNNDCSGNYIIVSNAKYKTYYGHLKEFIVHNLQSVVNGERIGIQGATGSCLTGKHTHYEVYENGILHNPLDY